MFSNFHFRYYNSWIEASEEESDTESSEGRETPIAKMQKNNLPPPPDKSSEDSLMKLNFVDAPSIMATDDEGSWCSTGNGASDSDSSSDASVCEVRSPGSKVSPKEKGSSLGISESGSGGIIFGNMDESVLQFGDLLDTEVIFVY